MQGQTEYKFERTIELPNFKANIFRPVLTEAERERRMKKIQIATANLMKGVKRS